MNASTESKSTSEIAIEIKGLVKKYGDEGFANKVLNRQIIRYKNDEQAHIYGRGWVNRANKVRTRISKL